jgi:hypothetical protein
MTLLFTFKCHSKYLWWKFICALYQDICFRRAGRPLWTRQIYDGLASVMLENQCFHVSPNHLRMWQQWHITITGWNALLIYCELHDWVRWQMVFCAARENSLSLIVDKFLFHASKTWNILTFLVHCKQFVESNKVAPCADVFNGSLLVAHNLLLRSNMFDFYCSLLDVSKTCCK